MLTTARCLVVGLGLRLGLDLVFRCVSGYAKVFKLLSIVIVAIPVTTAYASRGRDSATVDKRAGNARRRLIRIKQRAADAFPLFD